MLGVRDFSVYHEMVRSEQFFHPNETTNPSDKSTRENVTKVVGNYPIEISYDGVNLFEYNNKGPLAD